MEEVTIIGLDLAKRVFQLHGAKSDGSVAFRKKLSRGGLLPFESPDCKHWKLIQEKPVITNGAFDSQNLAFWDSDR